PEAPDANYYTPVEIEAKIDSFVKSYPQLARKLDLTTLPGAAKTHDKRGIFALKVSDNVATDEDEPAILLAANHHARELTTPVMVFGAIDRILKGYATDPQLKALVDGYEILFVPCVNPDGVNWVWTKDNWWRKNRRPNGGTSFGVDNNRNYPFLWGKCGASTRTTSQTYKGPSAASEPENKAMMALSRSYRPEIYLDFHSSGREVLFTYAPCATVTATIKALINRYKDSLRTPMQYATRLPSASGEAPEFHWSDGGTMSFLTEVNQSFQPAYPVAVSEEARVWPGIRQALTTWRPAVRGHVTSVNNKQPLAATITYTPNVFTYGEQGGSRARDGRYCLWLPIGTFQVTFTASGHQPVTRTVKVTGYDNPQTQNVILVPTMPQATLAKTGSDRIGTTTQLTYSSPGDVGEIYWVVLSGGTTPGLPVGAGRVIPINPDGIFFASITPNVLLRNNIGKIGSSGKAVASLPIPNLPGLVGIKVFAAGVTENTRYLGFVKNFSTAVPIQIKP
ncbi:MAG: M14 family zinc carboxypeptidase, partial [Planctomycetota bacterium]